MLGVIAGVVLASVLIGSAPAQATSAGATVETCGGPVTVVAADEVPFSARGFDGATPMVGRGALWTLPDSLLEQANFDPARQRYRVKIPWFRAEPGHVRLAAKRLDGTGKFSASRHSRGEYPSVGFEPSVMEFSSAGCWKVTARLRSSTFVFHLQVHADAGNPRLERGASSAMPTLAPRD